MKGVPINEYCDKNHLPTKERLRLFVAVCQSIHHAHEKGVIHRDIKPSNILVTLHDGRPVPKVIDFGIAKATNQKLTEKTLFTHFAQMIGTPAYMSPEQAEMSGLDIDTRTDVYSLGVLLYELLTGTTPFPEKELLSKGYGETVKVWDATSGQETLTLKGHSGPVLGVAFSADGRLLASTSADQTVKIWDATSGQEMLMLKGHNGGVWGVAFSPDGKRLVSASEDKTLKVWDATSGEEMLALKGHGGRVFSVVFSPDGKRLASASDDQTVKVWDAASGQELLSLKGHTAAV